MKYIEESAFLRGAYLEDVILSKNLEVIEKDAFNNNSKMKQLLIHENILSIGQYAFHNCSNLTKLDIKANESDIDLASNWMPDDIGKKLDDLVVTMGGEIVIDNR